MKTLYCYFRVLFLLCFFWCAGCSWLPSFNGESTGNSSSHEDKNDSKSANRIPSPVRKPLASGAGQKTQPNSGIDGKEIIPRTGDNRKSVEIHLPQRSHPQYHNRVTTVQVSTLKERKYKPAPQSISRFNESSVSESESSRIFSYHNQTLTEDTRWSGRVFIKGSLTIAPQATLTIGEGTVISFIPEGNNMQGGVLLIHGRVVGRAKVDRPILFRSDIQKGKAAKWQGIVLIGSEKNNFLENCRIEGAEIGLDTVFSIITLKDSSFVSNKLGIRAQDSLINTTGGEITKCYVGVALIDSETDIRKTVFSSNTFGLTSSGSSLNLTGVVFKSSITKALDCKSSKIQILNSKFVGNLAGLSLDTSDGALTGNRIVNNRGYGLRLIRSRIKISGNIISHNSGNGIMSYDGNAALWGNNIFNNRKYDLFHSGCEDIRAMGNWWGMSNPADVKKRIYDRKNDSRLGSVIYSPVATELVISH